MLNKDLLDILCCPACKGELTYSVEQSTLTCTHCARVFQVKDDIPIMLLDDDPGSGQESPNRDAGGKAPQ